MCTRTAIEPQRHKETAASLADTALAVLGAAEPAEKVRLTWEAARAWRELVRRHFKGNLKPPFNADARRRAGFGPDYYAQPGA